ncbi:MAG: zinc metalloprotease HtpX [Candidatus Aenigmarchaeota archaeon]|nr:zinc metalloprotease HtpX [Candidatus Aenigmarchaeota archaeon]
MLLFGLLTGIFLAIGYLLGGTAGMGLALILAFILNFISYWYSDKIVLRIYRAKPSQDKKLNDMVEKLSREAKIPKPAVFIVPSKAPNAFATGRNPKHAALAVTEGLGGLTDEEKEGVLSHEIGHITNRDILVSTVAATLAGAISYIAQIGYFSLYGRNERGAGNIIGLILIVVFAPLAALMIRMAISRSREYRADRYGAVLTKNPKGLASALRKISAIAQQHPMEGGSNATSHLWIVNPFRGNAFTNMFSTHPPMEQRIRRLMAMEGQD